jgi:hypothetical protein
MADHQHVVKQEDGWAVRGEGNSRYTARAMKTQENSSLMSLQEKAFAAKKSGQVAGPKPSHLRLKHHFY